MSWILWCFVGFLVGLVVTSFIWYRITERDNVGELRVTENDTGGKPLIYLAMRSDGYSKLRKGKYVTFYVQDDPPSDI